MRTPQKPILTNRISSVGCDLIKNCNKVMKFAFAVVKGKTKLIKQQTNKQTNKQKEKKRKEAKEMLISIYLYVFNVVCAARLAIYRIALVS